MDTSALNLNGNPRYISSPDGQSLGYSSAEQYQGLQQNQNYVQTMPHSIQTQPKPQSPSSLQQPHSPLQVWPSKNRGLATKFIDKMTF